MELTTEPGDTEQTWFLLLGFISKHSPKAWIGAEHLGNQRRTDEGELGVGEMGDKIVECRGGHHGVADPVGHAD